MVSPTTQTVVFHLKQCFFVYVSQMAHMMAQSTQDTIKRYFGKVPIHIDAVKEQQDQAIGNGTGIMYVICLTKARIHKTFLTFRGD